MKPNAVMQPRRKARLGRILLFLLLIDGLLLGGAELLAGWLGPPYHRQVVAQQGLAQAKAPGEKRIFLFGESTIDGWPYTSKASIAGWLQETLRAVVPGVPVRVCNFGKPGRGSHHLKQAVRETLALQPDLVIVCVGHNEYLARTLTLSTQPIHRWSYFNLNLYRLAYDKVCNVRSRMGKDFSDASAEGFRPDSETAREVSENFARNLEEIARLCRDQRVPLLLCWPASNLEWVPTAGYYPESLTDTDTIRWQQEFQAGLPHWRRGEFQTLASLAIEPLGHARWLYWRGRSLRYLQEESAAYSALRKARDADGLPLRAQANLAAVMQQVAQRYGAQFLSLPDVFAAAAEGVPDSTWFMDHCHPRPWGQRLMAEAFARKIAEQGYLGAKLGWQWSMLPSTEAIANRLGVEPRAWVDPERNSICKQMQLNPELAVDLSQRPPLGRAPADPEWLALQALSLAAAGRTAEAEAVRCQVPTLADTALKTWPAEVQQRWQSWNSRRVASRQ